MIPLYVVGSGKPSRWMDLHRDWLEDRGVDLSTPKAQYALTAYACWALRMFLIGTNPGNHPAMIHFALGELYGG